MSKANSQGSGKRHAEIVEMASASKRQAVETSLASPKSSSPSRITSLSRDSSFKSLDKGKVKIAHQTSFVNRFSVDILEVARPSSNGPRLQTPKGKKKSLIVIFFCLFILLWFSIWRQVQSMLEVLLLFFSPPLHNLQCYLHFTFYQSNH